MNAVELCVLALSGSQQDTKVTLASARELTQKSAMRYDRDGDDHYDIVSAYQKSMRGSDPDAALHYLARLLEAGDLPSACRRLLVCACEDVGLAWPQIIPIVKSAVDIALQVGLPEARIPLADAVVLVCRAPKSNSAYLAINAAMADVQKGNSGPIPRQLQNKHFDGEDQAVKGQHYLYAHDFDHHWVQQQYLPDNLKGRVYYQYGDNKNEQAFAAYWNPIKKQK
jgi:putative ATPase